MFKIWKLCSYIHKYNLFIPSQNFQQKISDLVNTSYSLRQSADALYKQAEDELLQELGLKDYIPQNKKCFIKNLSEVEAAERFDAEYFQPKYEAVIEKLRGYKGGCDVLGNVFDNVKQSFKIESNKKYNYVEIGDVNVSDGIITCNEVVGAELPANAKFVLSEGDVVVSQVRPYRGAIAIVNKDGYVGSGAFSVLHEKKNSVVNKETLFVFLRTSLMLDFSLRFNTGTSYPVITNNDILNFDIPLFPQSIQQSLSSKIQQSFANREKSLQLLELAKKAVEVAIEEGEEEAMKLKINNS